MSEPIRDHHINALVSTAIGLGITHTGWAQQLAIILADGAGLLDSSGVYPASLTLTDAVLHPHAVAVVAQQYRQAARASDRDSPDALSMKWCTVLEARAETAMPDSDSDLLISQAAPMPVKRYQLSQTSATALKAQALQNLPHRDGRVGVMPDAVVLYPDGTVVEAFRRAGRSMAAMLGERIPRVTAQPLGQHLSVWSDLMNMENLAAPANPLAEVVARQLKHFGVFAGPVAITMGEGSGGQRSALSRDAYAVITDVISAARVRVDLADARNVDRIHAHLARVLADCPRAMLAIGQSRGWQVMLLDPITSVSSALVQPSPELLSELELRAFDTTVVLHLPAGHRPHLGSLSAVHRVALEAVTAKLVESGAHVTRYLSMEGSTRWKSLPTSMLDIANDETLADLDVVGRGHTRQGGRRGSIFDVMAEGTYDRGRDIGRGEALGWE